MTAGAGAPDKVSCQRHGSGQELARESIDPHIANLPPNQGGAARHMCAYCAFESGYRLAERELEVRLRRLLGLGRFG